MKRMRRGAILLRSTTAGPIDLQFRAIGARGGIQRRPRGRDRVSAVPEGDAPSGRR